MNQTREHLPNADSVPAAASTLPYDASPTTPAAPAEIAIAGYEILALLGRGGMGVVYKARHVRLNRVVAVKMVLAGAHAGAEQLRRLHTEAEAIARLQHPNIVQIFEVSEVNGCPYLALEFVDGGTLAQRLKGTPWSANQAVQLVDTLARTIHYAHEHGVVHRDLKPANILLQIADCGLGIDEAPSASTNEQRDAMPSAIRNLQSAIPKVSDFGLAKMLAGGPELTQTGAFMGTPSYAAPEQAAGETRSSGPAADIYALGAILYELLTGRPPFRAASTLETLDQVRRQEPVPPRLLNPAIHRDVETICLKCLRKTPRERYASAAELADDLRRFSTGEPIRARPAGVLEQFAKWVKRRPALAASIFLGVLTATALSVLGVGSSFYSQLQGLNVRLESTNSQLTAAKKLAEREGDKARQLEAKAVQQEAKAVQERYFSDVQLASRAWQEGHMLRMATLLERQKPEFTKGKDLRGFEWHYLHPLLHTEKYLWQGGDLGVLSVAFAPGSSVVAAGCRDGTIKLWDTDEGRELLFFPKQSGSVTRVAFAPDGGMLATAIDGHGTILFWNLLAPFQKPLAARDGKLPKEEFLIEAEYPYLYGIAFDPQGSRIAAVSYEDYKNGSVQVWNVETRREVFHRPMPDYPRCVAFHPDGRHLAVGLFKQIKIWDTHGKEKTARSIDASDDDALIGALAYSPDGRRLVSAALSKKERAIKVWDAATGVLAQKLEGHGRHVACVAFNADGTRLASGGYDASARIWDMASGQAVRVLKGHTSIVYGVAFHANGKQLASAGDDQTVRIWDIGRRLDALELTAVDFGHHTDSLHFAGADSLVATVGNGGIATWNPHTGEFRGGIRLPSGGKTLLSRDGRRAMTLRDGRAKLWNVDTAKEAFTIAEGGTIKCAAFDAAGRWLALGRTETVSEDDLPVGVVELWDVALGKQQRRFLCSYRDVTSLAFSPDGGLLAVGGQNTEPKIRVDLHALTILNVSAGNTVYRSTLPLSDPPYGIAFSPDGNRVAWVSWDGSVRVLDRAGNSERLIGGHVSPAHSAAFSPDGKRLATGSEGDIRLWDVASGQETLTLLGHVGEVYALAFSADGELLASGGWDTIVRVWRAPRTGTAK